MKKIVPVIMIVILLGGAYYFYSKNNSSKMPQTMTKQISEAQEWANAIASGKPTLCNVTKGEEKMEYLIKDKKMKATIQTVVDSTKTTSYMINDGQYIYLWEENKEIGTKMTIPSEEEAKKMADSAKDYSTSMPDTPNFDSESGIDNLKNEGYTINCNNASASDADFVPPTSVKFQDLSELTRAIPSPNSNGEYDMKALEELAKQYGANMPEGVEH